ncbi:hypothetical protein GTHT12_01599 [Geobacillus thermodenitrificans]|nr:hypothetical protein GTHT12_01599 [Geobacillus thermodenitrificans]MEC5189335.1 hypothetical protein [Geobacillus thermodenitrificans]
MNLLSNNHFPFFNFFFVSLYLSILNITFTTSNILANRYIKAFNQVVPFDKIWGIFRHMFTRFCDKIIQSTHLLLVIHKMHFIAI